MDDDTAYPWADKWGDDFKAWYTGASREERDAYKTHLRAYHDISPGWTEANLRWADAYDAGRTDDQIAAEPCIILLKVLKEIISLHHLFRKKRVRQILIDHARKISIGAHLRTLLGSC